MKKIDLKQFYESIEVDLKLKQQLLDIPNKETKRWLNRKTKMAIGLICTLLVSTLVILNLQSLNTKVGREKKIAETEEEIIEINPFLKKDDLISHKFIGGMGIGEDEEKQIVQKNCANEDNKITSLPVYKNAYRYQLTSYNNGLSFEEMYQELDDLEKHFNLEGVEKKLDEDTSMPLSLQVTYTNGISFTIFENGMAKVDLETNPSTFGIIEYESAVVYTKEHLYKVTGEEYEVKESTNLYEGQYFVLKGMDALVLPLFELPFTYSLENENPYFSFEIPLKKQKELIGNFKIISYEKAIEHVLNQQYISYGVELSHLADVMYGISNFEITNTSIVDAKLLYLKNDVSQNYFIPYYQFNIFIGSPEISTYVPVYIPAIDSGYFKDDWSK